MNPTMFDRLLGSLNGSVILMGDLNAHHKSWGGNTNNYNGNMIVDIAEDHHLIIMNDGSPTRLTPPSDNSSPVDLTLASCGITHNIECFVLSDCAKNDDFPTVCHIKMIDEDPTDNMYNSNNIRLYSRAEWNRYKNEITQSFQNGEVSSNDSLIGVINKTTDLSLPTNNMRSVNHSKQVRYPWWDQE
ncbi:hypothetical protein JTB14_000527 [Gonioctena quinquepunctata]|nr:hypothetical protein JTB14_000527 [Gonioctena quinquepunctata]